MWNQFHEIYQSFTFQWNFELVYWNSRTLLYDEVKTLRQPARTETASNISSDDDDGGDSNEDEDTDVLLGGLGETKGNDDDTDVATAGLDAMEIDV